jgi:hypothetical protein
MSRVEIGLAEIKDALKQAAIEYIKQNQSCSETDLQGFINAQFPEEYAAMFKTMLALYSSGAFNAGLIPENTFEAFRAFDVNTPIDALEAL